VGVGAWAKAEGRRAHGHVAVTLRASGRGHTRGRMGASRRRHAASVWARERGRVGRGGEARVPVVRRRAACACVHRVAGALLRARPADTGLWGLQPTNLSTKKEKKRLTAERVSPVPVVCMCVYPSCPARVWGLHTQPSA